MGALDAHVDAVVRAQRVPARQSAPRERARATRCERMSTGSRPEALEQGHLEVQHYKDRITAPSKTPVKARTIPQLQSAIERKLDKFAHGQPLSDHLTQGMNARFEALERKLDSVLTALPQSSLALRQKKKRALLVALPGRASTRSSAGQSVPLPTGSPGASSGQVQISVSVLASSGQVWPSASAEVERLTA